jgi:hypothetical protein
MEFSVILEAAKEIKNRACQKFCVNSISLQERNPLVSEQNGELVERHPPLLYRYCPLFRSVANCQIKHLEYSVVIYKRQAVARNFSQLVVKTFDGTGR